MAYGNYVTSPVPNTTLQELLINGVLKGYEIKAESGYLLHDKDLDVPEVDENYMETGNIIPWFTGGGTSVRLDYDFTTTTQGEYKYTDENGNEITMPVTMIGAREFYTVPSNVVPSDQVLGGGENYGKTISLADGVSVDDYHEITDAEYEEIIKIQNEVEL